MPPRHPVLKEQKTRLAQQFHRSLSLAQGEGLLLPCRIKR